MRRRGGGERDKTFSLAEANLILDAAQKKAEEIGCPEVLCALLPPDLAPLEQWRFRGEIVTDFNCNWKILADRYAGEPWYFPGLAIEADGPVIIVHQIVPRTRLRSRVVRHLYFPDGTDAAIVEAAVARTGEAAARDKARVDAAQESCAAGDFPPEPPPSEALSAFRARIRAVRAQAPPG